MIHAIAFGLFLICLYLAFAVPLGMALGRLLSRRRREHISRLLSQRSKELDS